MGLRTPSTTPALQRLAEQFPVQSQSVARGLEAAQTVGLQKQLGEAARAGQPIGARQIAAAGAQQTAGQAQIRGQAAQQTIKQQQQVQQLGLQEEQMAQKRALSERAMRLQRQQRQAEASLFGLNESLKSRLMDDQLQFQKDELGRTLFNERQLMDYAITKAKSAEDFANYQQKVTVLSKRKMQALQTAHLKIEQALRQEQQKSETTKNRELETELAKKKMALEEKIRKEQADAANRASMFNAAGTIIGAGIGAAASIFMPAAAPALISGGAALGGGAGSIVAGETAKRK